MGFKPEPISIPAARPPKIGIPLPSAEAGPGASSDLSHLPTATEMLSSPATSSTATAASSAWGAAAPGDPAGAEQLRKAELKAEARRRDFERLSANLANSEIVPEELCVMHNLGHGSSGLVQKVLHVPSDSVLALKVIPVNADEMARKSILLELKTLHESMHPAIVSFYGAFYREGAVHIALEFMDASLLDLMRAERAPLPEPLLSAIAQPVLCGLAYLHRERHTIHRDIKPSNLLVDSLGNVKIADFGVSGELSCTLSKCASWVGTMHYMSPERIQNTPYSYDSDVWSLGITLLELSTGAFPYWKSPARPQRLGFWDLLDCIVKDPAPSPPPSASAHFTHFISACLQKEPRQRASSTQLLQHPLLLREQLDPSAMALWIRGALSKMPPPGGAEGGAAPADEAAATMQGWGETLGSTQTARGELPWASSHQAPPSEQRLTEPHHRQAPFPAPLAASEAMDED